MQPDSQAPIHTPDGEPHFLMPALLGRMGSLVVRLAEGRSEVEAAQRLRHRVFAQAFAAEGTIRARPADDLDSDFYDAFCDHLLVIDQAAGEGGRIVGTYRLLRQEMAMLAGGFYSNDEFELAALCARHPGLRFLELGRSCVLPEYRSRRTVELLWQGIWAYARRHRIDVMAGCASFPGTIPAAHAEALAFLHHDCRAEGAWHVRAAPARFRTLDLMPKEAVRPRQALASMPPLIKGYLRLGAMIGEGCVVDAEFGTTDVFIVLPVERISQRYINHFGVDAERFAG